MTCFETSLKSSSCATYSGSELLECMCPSAQLQERLILCVASSCTAKETLSKDSTSIAHERVRLTAPIPSRHA